MQTHSYRPSHESEASLDFTLLTDEFIIKKTPSCPNQIRPKLCLSVFSTLKLLKRKSHFLDMNRFHHRSCNVTDTLWKRKQGNLSKPSQCFANSAWNGFSWNLIVIFLLIWGFLLVLKEPQWFREFDVLKCLWKWMRWKASDWSSCWWFLQLMDVERRRQQENTRNAQRVPHTHKHTRARSNDYFVLD